MALRRQMIATCRRQISNSAVVLNQPPYWGPPPPSGSNSNMMDIGYSTLPTNSPRVKQANEYIMKPKRNKGVCIVPRGELWVVERLGKYSKTLDSGLNILIPFIDRVAYAHSSKV